ncbi:MAG: GrpB family protein [Caulobacteraceae bacterium]
MSLDPPNDSPVIVQLDARPINSTIHLADYDPRWPAWYAKEEAKLTRALEGLDHTLWHVGSTSVPGLAAKPLIDILLAVPDAAREADYVDRIESTGYRLHLREPNWHEHRLFKGPRPPVNLHVFSAGSSEITRMLAFRDRVRAHDDERALYEAEKRRLAAQVWARTQDYADAKSTVVEAIIARALAG